MSVENRDVLQKSIESMKFVNGRYSVAIPWKNGAPELPSNYEMAARRLENTEKRLQKDTTVKTAYCNTIDPYVKKGYIYKVETRTKSWFLPHLLFAQGPRQGYY